MLDSARLVVTELVTNSILHGMREGDGWVDVTIERRPFCLRIEVADPASSGLRPVLRPVGPDEHVRDGACSSSTGSRPSGASRPGSGTRVWCELATTLSVASRRSVRTAVVLCRTHVRGFGGC